MRTRLGTAESVSAPSIPLGRTPADRARGFAGCRRPQESGPGDLLPADCAPVDHGRDRAEHLRRRAAAAEGAGDYRGQPQQPPGCAGTARTVAAADYFLSNPALAWFSLNVIRILPIDRQRNDAHGDPLVDMSAALSRGEILIVFPEGSRGAPEQLGRFKSGIARLAERHPDVPIVPVFLHGLGKSLPRGEFLLVPFIADVVVGEALHWRSSVSETMRAYQMAMEDMSRQLAIPAWE